MEKRDEQIRAVFSALTQQASGLDTRYDPWRIKTLAEKWVDELNTVEVWEQIPPNAEVAYDKLGGAWYREHEATTKEPLPAWRNLLTEETLCRIYGPMTNIPTDEASSDVKTDTLPNDFGTILGAALGHASIALDMINNGKRNRAYFLVAHAACSKALKALKELTGGAKDGA